MPVQEARSAPEPRAAEPPSPPIANLIAGVRSLLPAGWGASLQLEDPLTRTLEEVVSSDPALGAHLLTLAPLPEAFAQTPPPWLLRQLGFSRAETVPLATERPFGRLLLLAREPATELPDDRREPIRSLCAERAATIERLCRRREAERHSARLRRAAESELGERFSEACLGLLPSAVGAAVLAVDADRLAVIRVRSGRSGLLEGYLRRTVPLSGSHVEAVRQRGGLEGRIPAQEIASYSEGLVLGPLLSGLGSGTAESVPLLAGERLVGSLVVFRRRPAPESERAATSHLAIALARGIDRMRPERGEGPRLLYLQELLRSAEDGLATVLRTVVEEIVAFMAADAGLLALVDKESGAVLLARSVGYGGRRVLPEAIPMSPSEGTVSAATTIAARVLRTGEPALLSGAGSAHPHRGGFPSGIAVPLRLRGETLGLALASSRRSGAFTDEDMPRFELLAGEVAVAVEEARLLESLRQQRQQSLVQRQREAFGFHPAVQADDLEYHFGNLVGDPRGPFGVVYRSIERLAALEDEIVLLVGETGTGKEMVAHAIHNASSRCSRPLVATNFAALGGDPNLIQSELFGHERGAFSGAIRRHRGCFEAAHRSTLLIDELGDIVPAVQVKLLRVLGRSSRRRFSRLGGEEGLTSDVRVLTATNKDLKREIAAGRFREDLYYRLSALIVRIPPLRERPDDIPLLTRHILVRLSGDEVRLRQGVLEMLQGYSWPGNVRQLESVLLRARVLFGSPGELTPDDVRQALALDEAAAPPRPAEVERLVCPDPGSPGWFWQEVYAPWKARLLGSAAIRQLLADSLEETGGYYTRVAARLGIARADYRRFLDFLRNSGLKVDYRPYRHRRG